MISADGEWVLRRENARSAAAEDICTSVDPIMQFMFIEFSTKQHPIILT